MRRKDLLEACVKMIKSFDPTITTVDAHIYDQLGIEASKRATSETSSTTTRVVSGVITADKLFIQQIFYGCIRYKDFLKILLSNFYYENSGRSSRNDYTLYMIMGYLALFRLQELGTKQFEAFVTTQDPTVLHVFLSYVFNPEKLRGRVWAEWIRVLDSDFLENQIIRVMEQHLEESINPLMERLHAKAFGMTKKTNATSAGEKIPTPSSTRIRPKSPNITKPKPRRIPEPMRIAQQSVALPVPANLNAQTLADLDKTQRERQAQVKTSVLEKYARTKPFEFQSTRTNVEQVRAQVEAEREAELDFDGFKAKPVPDMYTTPETTTTNHASSKSKLPLVKLNTAAILREDALYKKKQAQEAKLIRAYEADLRDSTEFYSWQSRKLREDEEKQKAEVEQRRLDMVASQREAIEASLRAKRENRKIAQDMRKTSVANELERHKTQEAHEAANRETAEELRTIRDLAPRLAQGRVLDEKIQLRQELTEELAREWARKQAEDAREHVVRQDLIRQIRALDRVHREHVVVFDPTSSSNLGLLEEMSLVELRERLVTQKIARDEAEQVKREAIVRDKAAKTSSLRRRIDTITKSRQAAASSNRQSRVRRKVASEARARDAQDLRNQGNIALAKKLKNQRETRDAEMRALAEEEAQIAKQRMFLGAAKSMMEELHFEQLEKGAERMANDRQERSKTESRKSEDIRRQDITQRQKRIKALQEEARVRQARRDGEVVDARDETQKQIRHDIKDRKKHVQREREHQGLATTVERQRNVYATNQSNLSITRGRTFAKLRHSRTMKSSMGKTPTNC